MIELIHEKETLIFGCGNPLFGDDGFGPEVIRYLEQAGALPPQAACLDVGTSIRDLLFDILLLENKPAQIIIIDAADKPGKEPGEIFEIDVDEVDVQKAGDFSLHQFPTTNMLKELKEHTDMRVSILVVQITDLPEEVDPGLSVPVSAAVPKMGLQVLDMLNSDSTVS